MAAAARQQHSCCRRKVADALRQCSSRSSSYSSSCSRSCSRSTSSDDGYLDSSITEGEGRNSASLATGGSAEQQKQQQKQGLLANSLSGSNESLSGVTAAANGRLAGGAPAAPGRKEAASSSGKLGGAIPAAHTVAAGLPAAATTGGPETVVRLSFLAQGMRRLDQKQQKLLQLRQQRMDLEARLAVQLSAAAVAHGNRSGSHEKSKNFRRGAPSGATGSCSASADGKLAATARMDDVAGMDDVHAAAASRNRARSNCSSNSHSSASRTDSNSSYGSCRELPAQRKNCSGGCAAEAASDGGQRSSRTESSSARHSICKLLVRLRSICCSMKKQLQQHGRCHDSQLLRYRSSKQRMAAAAAELQQQQQGVYCLRVLKLHEVVQLLPIENSESGRSILSLPLPPLPELIGTLKDSKRRAEDALTVSAAAGFAVMLLLLISRCTDTPLQQRLLPRGARSVVCSPQGEETPLYLREGASATDLQQLHHGLLLLLQTVEGLATDRGHAAKPAAEGDLLQRIEALLHNELWGFEAAL
ncbi:hypothetical protein Efla_001888 [Eimeria flavescens]